MTVESDKPIPIACAQCHNQVEKTFQWLSDNELLECPSCRRNMASERAAVIQHVRTIRKTIADFARDAGRTINL
jgi:NAD-dependent SIR2 family protein deacetylase